MINDSFFCFVSHFPAFSFLSFFFLTRNVNIDYVHIIHPPALFLKHLFILFLFSNQKTKMM